MAMTQAQQDSATAAMAYAYAMTKACQLSGKDMWDAVNAANAATEAAGIDPAKVGRN